MAKPSEEQNDRCSQCEESSRCVRERQHQGNAVVPYRCLTKCKSDSIPQRRGYLIARHLAGMCHRFTALPAGLRQGNQTIPQSSYSKWLFVSDADIFHSKTPCPSEPWSGQRNAMPVPLFRPALPRVTVVMGLLTGKFPGVNCSGSAHMVPQACLQPAQPLHPTERTFHQKKSSSQATKLSSARKCGGCMTGVMFFVPVVTHESCRVMPCPWELNFCTGGRSFAQGCRWFCAILKLLCTTCRLRTCSALAGPVHDHRNSLSRGAPLL